MRFLIVGCLDSTDAGEKFTPQNAKFAKKQDWDTLQTTAQQKNFFVSAEIS